MTVAAMSPVLILACDGSRSFTRDPGCDAHVLILSEKKAAVAASETLC